MSGENKKKEDKEDKEESDEDVRGAFIGMLLVFSLIVSFVIGLATGSSFAFYISLFLVIPAFYLMSGENKEKEEKEENEEGSAGDVRGAWFYAGLLLVSSLIVSFGITTLLALAGGGVSIRKFLFFVSIVSLYAIPVLFFVVLVFLLYNEVYDEDFSRKQLAKLVLKFLALSILLLIVAISGIIFMTEPPDEIIRLALDYSYNNSTNVFKGMVITPGGADSWSLTCQATGETVSDSKANVGDTLSLECPSNSIVNATGRTDEGNGVNKVKQIPLEG